MKLLMITQKIDKEDDILGVYHEWAREIAKSFERFSVICLFQGATDLPESIKVFSLGKEVSKGFGGGAPKPSWRLTWTKAMYILNLYKYTFVLRRDYDAVFVHMNPIYILLGFLPWKIMGKKICMWYAHPSKNILVRLAYFLCDKVITSVPEAFFAKSNKVIAIGQGIDIERFKNPTINRRINRRILSLGRISPAKRIDVLLESIKILREKGVELNLSVVGNPSETYGGKDCYKKLLEYVESNNLSSNVYFEEAVPNSSTPDVYIKHGIFVNLSPTGYFDKTVLEAMSCELLVLASNDAYKNIFTQDLHAMLIFKQDDSKDLAEKILRVYELPQAEKEAIGRRLRAIVEQDHSIFTLGERLKNAITS